MGQAASKTQATVREAHAHARSKPKNNRNVQRQKLQAAEKSGVLALQQSKLKVVPREVLQLVLLRTLDLSANRLVDVPPEMNALTSLKTLKLQSNAITTLPALDGLGALTTLVLDGNEIAALPHALPPQLTKLSLQHNRLRVLPQTITSLPQLRELDVAHNQLTAIPVHIQDLVALVELNVDGNAITALPAALARCTKLKVLSAKANALAKAPTQCIAVEVLADSAIEILHLHGNALSKLDLEQMDGIEAFLERRTRHKNKEIHGGLSTDTSLCGLD